MNTLRIARVCVLLLVCACFALLASAQDGPASIATAGAYPESADGLKSLLHDIFAAIQSGDTQKSSQLLATFALPKHKQWFPKMFGASEGERLDAKYLDTESKAPEWLDKRLHFALRDGKTQVTVDIYTKPVPANLRLFKAVTEAMVSDFVIYNATAKAGPDDKNGVFLGDFAYVDGGFRYIDRQVFQALSTAPAMRISVGGNVQAAKIVGKVQPVYPEEARHDHIEGTVSLHVVIGKDGTVQQAALVSGHPALAQSAIDAVKQWRYQPTLLNGSPVEVDTQVNVVYSLAP